MQDSKKSLLDHQDSRHFLLINAEDPRQYTYLRNLKKNTPGDEESNVFLSLPFTVVV